MYLRKQLALWLPRRLLTHIQLVTNQNPQTSFYGVALQPRIPQFLSVSRITPSQVENMAPVVLKFHVGGGCPVLYSLNKKQLIMKTEMEQRHGTFNMQEHGK